MSAAKGYNKNNAGVKRILREAAELAADPSSDYTAQPLEDDMFEWHCTMRGPTGTAFEGGLYHFRIILPAEYPFRPPSVVMLTPSGRFECGTKICISFTGYHEELWQPAWGVRTAIIALQGFFPLKGQAAIGVGALEYPDSERKRLALLSKGWTCPDCQTCNEDILPLNPSSAKEASGSSGTSADPSPTPKSEPQNIAAALSTPSTIETPAATTPIEPAPSLPHANTIPPVQQHHTQIQSQVRTTSVTQKSSRPPILLDGAICTLLVLVAAMLFKRIF